MREKHAKKKKKKTCDGDRIRTCAAETKAYRHFECFTLTTRSLRRHLRTFISQWRLYGEFQQLTTSGSKRPESHQPGFRYIPSLLRLNYQSYYTCFTYCT